MPSVRLNHLRAAYNCYLSRSSYRTAFVSSAFTAPRAAPLALLLRASLA